MASSWASSRPLTARTVHIKLFPTPRSFPEHREVLRVLERFGEVAMFRSLKYEPRQKVPNAFLSLFTTESAAQDLINASPIRYRLIAEAPPLDPSSEPFLSATAPEDVDEFGPKPIQEEKSFELSASVSTFDHIKYLTSPSTNPLHGPFTPMDARRSYIAMSLGKIIPNTMWSKGLKDWDTAGLNWRNIGMETTDGESGEEANVEFQVAQRVRKRKEEARPRVMRGLKVLVEERQRVEADRRAHDEKMKLQELEIGEERNERGTAPFTAMDAKLAEENIETVVEEASTNDGGKRSDKKVNSQSLG